MSIQILSENLQKRISLLQHAISSKNQLPILQNILLVAKDGNVHLSATDLDMGIQISIPAKIEEEGSVVVFAKTFIELINSLPSEKISLQTEGTTLTVLGKNSKSTFSLTAAEEFPNLYEEKGEHIATISMSTLQKDLNKVIFGASIDSARPALTGVLMKPEDKGFLLVATDAFRLSIKHVVTDQSIQAEGNPLLVQVRVLRELVQLKDEETVSLYVSAKNNQIIFEGSQTVLVGRLIEAEFPTYEKIIPSEHSLRVNFDREELQKAVKICSIFARETDNVVKLSFAGSTITVSANTASSQNTVDVQATLTGEENEIAFNAKYLLDLFTHVEEKDMIFEMQGPLNSGVFKLQADDSFLHIIMPVRVQG